MAPLITPTMLVLTGSALALVLAMFVIAVVRRKSLPEKLPSHFDLNGRPDNWSGRRFIWFHPVFGLVIIAALTMTSRNGPAELETSGAFSLYVAAMIFYIMLRGLAVAEHRVDGLGRWFLPVSVLALSLPVIYIFH